MGVKSLFKLCAKNVCEHIGSYSDIINSLFGKVPHTVLDKLLKHHIKNCMYIQLEYINIIPASLNYFRERVCTDCYTWTRWDSTKITNSTLRMQKSVWERIKRNRFECEYCGESLATYVENSCECK